jgi:hypothetical protein
MPKKKHKSSHKKIRHEIDWVDPSVFDHKRRVLFLGPSMAGKSVLMEHIIRLMNKPGKHIQFGIGISKTEEANFNLGGRRGERGILPKIFVRNTLEPKFIGGFISFMKKMASQGRVKRTLVILDDVVCDKSAINSKEMNELMMNARNMDTGTMATSQGVRRFGPDARINYHIIVSFDLGGETEKLWEVFYKPFMPDKHKFFRMFRRVVREPYTAMVLLTYVPGGVKQKVFKIKAPFDPDNPPKKPRLCELGFWWIDRDAYDDPFARVGKEIFDTDAMRAQLGLKPQMARKSVVEEDDETASSDESVDVSFYG